jgi:hypothetical protein
VEFTHGFKSSFYNTVSFSSIRNSFYGYPIQNDSTKESLQTVSNMDECYVYGYGTYYQKEFKKWWMFTINGGINYVTFKGKVQNIPYAGNSLQANAYMSNQFTIQKSVKLEMTLFYLAPSNVVIYRNKDRWNLSLALRKNLLKDKLNVYVGVNDLFFTFVNRTTVRYRNIHSDLLSTYDSRRFRAGLTYNFGKIKVQQRQTKSNQEEARRLEH